MPAIIVVTAYSKESMLVRHLLITSVREVCEQDRNNEYNVEVIPPSGSLPDWDVCLFVGSGLSAPEIRAFLERLRQNWPDRGSCIFLEKRDRLLTLIELIVSLQLPRIHYLTYGLSLGGALPQRDTGLVLEINKESIGLSERELEVLRLVAEGNSNNEIGATLHISGMTVKSHLVRIGRKLGANSRSKMVAIAFRLGIV